MRGMPFSIGKERLQERHDSRCDSEERVPLQAGQRSDVKISLATDYTEKTDLYKRAYRSAPTVSRSNTSSATARAFVLTFGSFTAASIAVQAASKSCSLKSSIKIAERASESPMPVLMTIGRPHARYSPFFVGDDASFEKQRLIKEIPTSPAAKYEGISFGATE